MTSILPILLATFLISLISFLGVLFLFLNEKKLEKILLFLVSFSAGALLGGAFLHLLPEAILESEASFEPFLYLLLGFCAFFVLEQFVHWHNCSVDGCVKTPKPFSYLILVGDAVHNFIDGVIIAGSFAVSPSFGLVTVVAVILHEIPQEIGDFGVLVYSGFKKATALWLNFVSGLTAILGGIVGFFILQKIEGIIFFLLAFAAGGFIYIASSDLIPEIKHQESKAKSVAHFFVFLAGLSLMAILKFVE